MAMLTWLLPAGSAGWVRAQTTAGSTVPPAQKPVTASALPASYFPYAGNVARYFPAGATLVKQADRANLQRVLDTRGVVRLEPGDYSDTPITIRAHQELYGVPGSATKVGSITVEPGAHHFVIKGVSTGHARRITFPPSGLLTREGCISMCDATAIYGDQASVERLLVASAMHCAVEFNNTTSGYLRNSRFLRMQTHGGGHPDYGFFGRRPSFALYGKADRSSWGNTLAIANMLGSWTNQVHVTGQADFSLLAMDSENYEAVRDGKAAVYLRNCGKVRINSVSGGLKDQAVLDNGADDLVAANVIISTNVGRRWTMQPNALRAIWLASGDRFGDIIDLAPASRLRIYQEDAARLFRVNGNQPAQLSGEQAQAAKELLAGVSSRAAMAWARPSLRPVADPGGAGWAAGRERALDDSPRLQMILDSQRTVAFLPAGRFIIGTPLRYYRNQTVIGAGSDQTHLIAKTAAGRIFVSAWGTSPKQTVGSNGFLDMTLQGGACGIHQGEPGVQLSGFNLSHVVFRDMSSAGIHLHNTFAWDNGWVAQCDFVRCAAGIKQQSDGVAKGEHPTISYMDKTNFFRCQFIDCDVALDFHPKRPNNLDTWTECYFKNSRRATLRWTLAHNVPFFINCVFDGNAGNPTCDAGGSAVYYVGCHFIAAPTGAFVNSNAYFEGCSFSRNGGNATLLSNGSGQMQFIHCALGDVPLGGTAHSIVALNSSFAPVDSAFQKPISVRWRDTTQYNWLDGNVAPGSQLLR